MNLSESAVAADRWFATEELKSLVIQVRSGNLDAYGEIVGRLQDMAYGYAYSLLGIFAWPKT